MHRQVAVATIFVCLVTPLFSAVYAQSCPPPTPPPITVENAEICAGASDLGWTTSGFANYSWTATHGSIVSSSNSGNVTFTADGSGDVVLSVTVTDANGCPASNSVTVPLHSIAAPTITAPAQICPQGGGTDVSVSGPDGGGSWLSAQWDVTNGYFFSYDGYPHQSPTTTGSSTQVYPDGSGLPMTLHVRVTDSQYCMADATATIGMRTIAAPVITAPAMVCPNGPGGDLSVAPPAEGGQWSYVQWDVTNAYFYGTGYPYGPTQTTSGNSVHFYPDGSGQPISVRVRVTDGQYCANEATTTIAMRTIAPPVITAPAMVCPNGPGGDLSVALPAGGGQWSYVQWDVTNAYFYGTSYPYGQTQTATGNSVHFYPDGSGQPISVRVRVTDDQYCGNEATTSIAMRTIAPPVITAPAMVCPNGPGGDLSVALPAEGGQWSYVQWDVTNAYFYGTSYPYGQTQTTTGNGVHFYPDGSGQPITVRVRVTDEQYCGNEATTTVAMRTIAPPVITAPAAVCPNGYGGDLSVALPAEGGQWSYVQWDVTNAYFYGTSYPYGPTQTATGNGVHFYPDGSGLPITVRVRVTDDQYCGNEATTTVAMDTVAPPDIQLNLPDICPAGTYNYASIDNQSGSWMNITWSVDHGTISSGNTGSSIYFNADSSGIAPVVHVTVQNGNGCTASNQVTVPLRTITAPDIHLNLPDICPAGTFNYASIDNPPVGSWMNIVWSVDHGTISSGNTGSYIYFNADSSGIAPVVHVTVQDDRGCMASNQVTVPLRTISAPDIHLNLPDICPAGTYNYASIDNPPVGSWMNIVWSVDHGTISSGNTGSYIYFNADSSGIAPVVHVTVQDDRGCMASNQVTVPLRTISAPDIHLNLPDICPAGTYNYASIDNPSVGSWMNIVWSVDHGTISSGNIGTYIYFNADSSGIPPVVHVTVQDDRGCMASNQVTVPLRSIAAPAINLQAPNICSSVGSGHASVDNPPAGSWMNITWSVEHGAIMSGNTSSYLDFTVDGSGIAPVVSVTVQDDRGCMATSSVTVPITAATPADFNVGSVCPGATGTASSVSNYSGYTWTIQNGTILSGANAHDVTFRASTDPANPTVLTLDASGSCTSPVTKTVPWTVLNNPQVLGSASVCPLGNGNETVSGTYSSYAWSITNGTITGGANASTVFFTAGSSGNVVLTLTVTANGCSNTSTKTVPIEDTTPPAIIAPDTICYLGTFTASVPAGYDHYAWWYDNVTEVSVVPNSNSVMLRSDGTGRPIDLRVTMWRDSGAQCQVVATKTVTYAATATPTIGFSVPPNFCTGMTGQASVTNGPYASYAWTISGGTISGPANGSSVSFIPDGSGTPQLTVQVTDGRGDCSTTGYGVSPFANFKPAIYTSNGTDICTGSTTTLSLYGSSTPDSYLWSTGATTPTISVSTAGDYTLTTTINGCSMTSAPLHINVHTATATITADKTAYCAGASPATLSLTNFTGLNGQYRYIYWYATDSQYSIGGGFQVYGHTASNYTRTYYAVISDETGCSATSNQITITVNSLPSATITPSGPTAICAGGSVTLTASSGSSYLWSNGATTQAITVNAAGSYSVTVTNANGCSATSSATGVTVNPLPTPTISASGATTFCAGGSVTLTASAASGYLWSNGATTQAITVNASGNYSVTVTDANGCSATSSATSVTVNPLPTPTISASGSTTFCSGGNVTLTASSASSYLWSNGATTQSIIVGASGNYSVTVTDANGCSATSQATTVTAFALPAPTINTSGATTFCAGGSVTLTASSASSYLWSNGATTQAITVNASGNYSVAVTDANGCSATSSATSVTVNPLPTPTISASGSTTFCSGGNVTLTASSASSYLWSNGATTQSIVVGASGNYSVTVTDANGCSATSQATTVTAFALPTPTINTSGATTFCAGGSVTLTASSASSYLWSNGATTQAITVNASGNYSVAVTDANGCTASSAATSVTVNPLPTPTISASGATTFCAGGSVTLTASAASSYLWSNGATTQAITVNASGNYSIAVTDANGCSATSAATSVTVNSNPSPSITAPAAICAGATGSASTDAISGATYAWTITNGTITSGTGTSAITFTSSSGPVSLGVTVTNSSNCSGSANATVNVNALPDATITAPSAICSGGSGSASVASVAGATYAWTITNGTITSGSGTNAITFTSASGPVSLGVTVTTSSNCSASANASVNVNALPNATITAPSAICSGGSGSASVASLAGATYAWTITNGTITSGSGTNAITFTSASGPVSLGITVTTSSNCSASANASVNVNALPNATITAPSAICSGGSGSASVASVAGATYAWTITNGSITGGNGTSSITFTSTSGTASLNVTVTSNGCSSGGTKDVTVNALPNATITAPSAICSGSTGNASVAAISGGSYSWSITGGTITGGSGTNAITFTSTGTTASLSVSVTNSNGCSATGNANVAVNANPATPTITPGGATTFCQGGSVTLTAPASAGYLWSDGETTQSIVVSTSGTYRVTVTNASGCTSAQSAPVTVTVNPATTITQQPQSITIPKNTHTTLSVTATGTGTLTYQWYNPPTANNNDTSRKVGTNSPTFTTPNLTKGTYYYYVVVTGSCGTVRSAIATVTSN